MPPTWRVVVAGSALGAVFVSAACSSANHKVAHSAATTSPATTSTTVADATPPCTASDLRVEGLATAHKVPAGHNLFFFGFTNAGDKACHLEGFPTLVLKTNHNMPMAFNLVTHGGVVITAHPPALVPMPVGAQAFVAIDKLSCKSGDHGTVDTATLTVPGDPTTTTVSAPAAGFKLCDEGDPGNTVEMSPFVARGPDALTS